MKKLFINFKLFLDFLFHLSKILFSLFCFKNLSFVIKSWCHLKFFFLSLSLSLRHKHTGTFSHTFTFSHPPRALSHTHTFSLFITHTHTHNHTLTHTCSLSLSFSHYSNINFFSIELWPLTKDLIIALLSCTGSFQKADGMFFKPPDL